MIRTFQVNLNAAHPEVPIFEAVAFTGSPSAAFIRGVPRAVGSWHITAVSVAVSYPDNTTATVPAKVGAEGVWTATLPACDTSGRVTAGFQVLADGLDENGDPVSGYVLGVGDFAVCTREQTVSPGQTAWTMHWFDAQPSPARKGDAYSDAGVVKLYDGAAWIEFDARAFAEVQAVRDDLSANYYTKQGTDAAIDRLAAYYITYTAAGAAFPTRADLLSASTVYSGGVARTPTRNDYAVVLADETHSGAEWRYIYAVADGQTSGQWEAQYPIETNDYSALSNKPQVNGHALSGNQTGAALGVLDLSGGTMQGAIQWRFGDSINGHTGTLVVKDHYGREWYFSRSSSAETGTGYVAWTHEIPYSLVQREIQPGGQSWKVTSTPSGVDPADVDTGFDGDYGWYFHNMATDEFFYTYNFDTEATSFSYDDYAAELTDDPGYVSLANHAVNAVTVGSAMQALALRFPGGAGVGKARDFALRLTLSAGVTTAPELVLDDNFTVETADGEKPAVEAATAGAATTTVVYFTETATGRFFAAAAPAKVVS